MKFPTRKTRRPAKQKASNTKTNQLDDPTQMIVQCKTNRFSDIDPATYLGLTGYSEQTIIHIDVGHTSIVYAMYQIHGSMWYLVDANLTYPMFYPSSMFSILNGTLSKYWQITNSKLKLDIKIGFKEMIEDDFFYGEFIEDDVKRTWLFDHYAQLMREEHGVDSL